MVSHQDSRPRQSCLLFVEYAPHGSSGSTVAAEYQKKREPLAQCQPARRHRRGGMWALQPLLLGYS